MLSLLDHPLKQLDKIDKLPDVLARDIGRLPDRQPEELNLLMLAQKVAELEKAKDVHNEVLTTLKIDMMNIKDGKDINKSNNIPVHANNPNSNTNTPVCDNLNDPSNIRALINNNNTNTSISGSSDNHNSPEIDLIPT